MHSLDWPALREAVAELPRLRPVRRRAARPCSASAAERAHWMVVGEAPGEQEDRRGEPFVGAAGQLLDRMLAALGLTRDADGDDPQRQVYIANTLKCRPPGNRNPAPEELARCEPFLSGRSSCVQPRIILAMGRFAVQALLRSDEPIGRLRGRVHQLPGRAADRHLPPGLPAAQPARQGQAWDDLCLAADTAARRRRLRPPQPLAP